jgi:DnaK suppressor protein
MTHLTEQDILNWHGPEDDYMNGEHLAFFKSCLLSMQEELLKNAHATTNHLQEQDFTPDPADRATLEEEYALELRTRDRERKLLQKIQSSLRNIEDGSYGFCEDTGEPIGLKRLLARPTATLSVEAQELRERRKKLYAD